MESEGGVRHESGSETVYGTHEDTAMVMSEKVWAIVIFLSNGVFVFTHSNYRFFLRLNRHKGIITMVAE